MHKDSITIAVLPAATQAPTRLERLPNDLPKLQQWIAQQPAGLATEDGHVAHGHPLTVWRNASWGNERES